MGTALCYLPCSHPAIAPPSTPPRRSGVCPEATPECKSENVVSPDACPEKNRYVHSGPSHHLEGE